MKNRKIQLEKINKAKSWFFEREIKLINIWQELFREKWKGTSNYYQEWYSSHSYRLLIDLINIKMIREYFEAPYNLKITRKIQFTKLAQGKRKTK